MNIRINNVEFSYNGTPVLQDVTENIEKGDFVSVVGPNGSGKSTLIKCINGILSARKGSILIDNQDINKYTLSELAKKMAYVPQHEGHLNPLTVFDTILLGRKPHINFKPQNIDLQIVSEIIKTLGLEHIAMKDIDKLSGGQRQCVFIARALAQEPSVLLLDEPTANLDLKHQLEILNLLKTLSDKGHTIIMAIHDINMAAKYCSKIIMLKEGAIFASGGTEIITTYNIENLYDVKVRIINDNNNLFVIPVSLNLN